MEQGRSVFYLRREIMSNAKAFEAWYQRHDRAAGGWFESTYKRVLRNAFNAGVRHAKKQAYAYGEIVRYN